MIGQKNPSVYKGMNIDQMRKFAAHSLVEPNPYGYNPNVTATENPKEGQHNYQLQRFRNFYQGLRVRRVILPHDTSKSQAMRQSEWMREASMPWGNQRMQTPTDANRLNNPSQQAFVSQKQLGIPNTYQQFYAFMHAMSAAFGNLKGNS